MKTLFLTNEYPPAIYGGAGVHVDYLSRELAKLMEVDVRAFGNQVMDATNLKVRGFPVDTSKFGCPKNPQSIFGAVRRCLDFQRRRNRCGRGSLPYLVHAPWGHPGKVKLRHSSGDHDPLA